MSKDDLGSRELFFPPLSSRNDYAHLFHLALTRLWAIYRFSLLAHFTVFTLHAMLASMPLPCNCDPCVNLPMIHHFSTHMCICMLGGDPCCYCHVYHVPHAIDAILPISCFHACAMSCELFMHTICTHDMLDMISSSTLHLRTTSLLHLITMIACFVASPMFHYYLFSWVDDIYVHASHMIYFVCCRLPPIVASMLIDHGDLDTLLVMHACLIEPIVWLSSHHHMPPYYEMLPCTFL